MVFTMQKMRKCLNYRYFRIGDQMADGFFEKSGLIGYYDRLELNRSDYRSDFRSDDGYSGRIIFFFKYLSISTYNIIFLKSISFTNISTYQHIYISLHLNYRTHHYEETTFHLISISPDTHHVSTDSAYFSWKYLRRFNIRTSYI